MDQGALYAFKVKASSVKRGARLVHLGNGSYAEVISTSPVIIRNVDLSKKSKPKDTLREYATKGEAAKVLESAMWQLSQYARQGFRVTGLTFTYGDHIYET